MSATGLEVFDKTVQTTNIWLQGIMEDLGPDRQIAWHVLGGVLRTLRDRLPAELSVHLGAQLPLLIRGLYYDQWKPADQPQTWRSLDEFLEPVERALSGLRPINVQDAVRSVFRVLSQHVDRGQLEHVRDALPEEVRRLWPEDFLEAAPSRAAAQRTGTAG